MKGKKRRRADTEDRSSRREVGVGGDNLKNGRETERERKKRQTNRETEKER